MASELQTAFVPSETRTIKKSQLPCTSSKHCQFESALFYLMQKSINNVISFPGIQAKLKKNANLTMLRNSSKQNPISRFRRK